MIEDGCPFAAEPWCLRETHLDLDRLDWSGSIFALSNGHLGLRGNLEEGEPVGTPGTFLNSVYELRPLPYAEGGYGYPESGETVINVTNGQIIRLLVDDEPFDVRYGDLISHERVLDLRSGVLRRSADWVSPAGQRVRIRTERIVSLSQRAVAAIRYEVEAMGDTASVVIQSELVVNEPRPEPRADDPRVAAALRAPLEPELHTSYDAGSTLVHRVSRSHIGIAAGMDHEWETVDGTQVSSDSSDDLGRFTITTTLAPGEKISVVKYLAYGWSSTRSTPALRDQVDAALTAARLSGWNGLLREQRQFLDQFWSFADVELGGDVELQQAIRFGMFHVLQAGARAEARPIASKGLTGDGYDGHTFWDTEVFILPMLLLTRPEAAADALRWRHSTLPSARRRAENLGLRGATFPWRTISGEECSGYWPAGTAAFHVNAAVADATVRYVDVSGDLEFEERIGLELLVETARLWRSLGHHAVGGRFRIDGITGPDEYSAISDNNVYTNLMAQRNLQAAAATAEKYPARSAELHVDADEIAQWRGAADAMFIPYDERHRIHPQSEGFTELAVWDFDRTSSEQYPLLRWFPYFDLYRKQVVKQADLVLAIQLCGDAFDEDQKRRDFDYYEQLTVRDSSLSACTQATVAAEVGHLSLAYDYLGESALVDLDDVHRNAGDGLHMASMGGSWSAVVFGFGGLRHADRQLSFAPQLPPHLDHIRFGVGYRGRHLRVTFTATSASYELLDGPAIELIHHGKRFTLSSTATLEISPCASFPPPSQPKGREPVRLPRRVGPRSDRS